MKPAPAYQGPYHAGEQFDPNRDPERPPPPTVIYEKGRRRSCLPRFCLFALLGAVLGLLLALLFIWLFYRPKAPKFALEEVNVSALSVSAAAPYALTADIAFVLLTSNPNRLALYYSRTNITMAYGGQIVGYALVPAFHQRKRSEQNVTGTFLVNNVSLAGTSALTDYLAGSLPLQFAGKIRGHIKIIGISSPSVGVQLKCNATINPQTQKLVSKNCNFHL